jgi:SAM-dependent methyltransferase
MGTQEHGYFDREYFTLHQGRRKYLSYLLELLAHSGVARGRILDVGSGLGFFIEAMAHAGFDAYGLEKSAHAARQAQERFGGNVAVGDAEAGFPFPDAHFTAVTLFDVIEHFHRVDEVLMQCRRVLEPKGKLFVISLNAGSLARPLLRSNWSFFLDSTHVTLFSKASLRRTLEDAGFEIKRLTTMSNFYLIGEGNPWLKPLRRVARIVTTPWLGDSLLAVAERSASHR